MNLFFAIAAAQAMFVACVLVTGRLRMKGQLLADRHSNPQRYWLYVAGLVAALGIVTYEALHPPY